MPAHISSLVVHCQPAAVEAVVAQIAAMPDAEVPEYNDQGKLVVLLETTSESAIIQRVSAIEELTGVISAALVYYQIDETESGNPT